MSERSSALRDAVAKWLVPNCAVPVRVRHVRSIGHKRCVAVESKVRSGSLTICFFQHDDRTWNVFPQRPKQLMMQATQTPHITLRRYSEYPEAA